jgi:hypothetical protein
VSIELAYFVGVLTLLFFLTKTNFPSILKAAEFVTVFWAMTYVARMISDDLGNKITFAMLGLVAGKTMSLVAPRAVVW